MSGAALIAALDEAKDLAARGEPVPEAVTDLVLRILAQASDTPAVLDALNGASAGRALLRITDGTRAIEFQAGDGTLSAAVADPKGKGPKVDATAATSPTGTGPFSSSDRTRRSVAVLRPENEKSYRSASHAFGNG